MKNLLRRRECGDITINGKHEMYMFVFFRFNGVENDEEIKKGGEINYHPLPPCADTRSEIRIPPSVRFIR